LEINGETSHPVAIGGPITWHSPKATKRLKTSESVEEIGGYITDDGDAQSL
jgi:hypothetical protein